MENSKPNRLASLLGAYKSDSDLDDDDDTEQLKPVQKPSTNWTQCFDKTSKLPYYWNIDTEELTWTIPEEYSKYLEYVTKNAEKLILEYGSQRWSVRHSTDGTDNPFFVDEIYRKVSWERPSELVNKPFFMDNKDKNSPHDEFPNAEVKSSGKTANKRDNILIAKNDAFSKRPETPPMTLFSANVTTISLKDIDGKTPLSTTTDAELKPPDNTSKSEPEIIISTKRKRRIDIQLSRGNNIPNNKNLDKIRQPEENATESENLLFKYVQFQTAGTEISQYQVDKVSVGTNTDLENIDSNDSNDDIQIMIQLVNGKIKFLSAGRPMVTGVQAMAIQLETLLHAYQTKDLSGSYIRKWLTEMSTNLEQLEGDVAPDGWECKWDRKANRYFYRSLEDGRIQWEFPLPDVVHLNDEMEISTTPPPHETEAMYDTKPTGMEDHANIATATGENPLGNDRLNMELDSFYSDIASIEQNSNEIPSGEMENVPTTNSSVTKSKKVETSDNVINSQVASSSDRLKRSKKVKTSLSDMKLMSHLITKWQKAQQDL